MAEKSPDQLARFHTAIGRFVCEYAAIETTMHQILRVVADVPHLSTRVMFSGMRLRGAVDLIRRFYEARRTAIPGDLGKALSRIGEITTARDRILHNGIALDGDAAIVTDETKNMFTRAFKTKIAVADIEALEMDAITIHGCLISFWIEERRPDLLNSEQYRTWKAYAQRPWQYKSTTPIPPQETFRAAAQERRRPRSPSGAKPPPQPPFPKSCK